MKCFQHRDVDAVAVCKYCGKALCSECAQESAAGTSCHGACEKQVAKAGLVLKRNAHMQRLASRFGALLTSILAGALFFLGLLSSNVLVADGDPRVFLARVRDLTRAPLDTTARERAGLGIMVLCLILAPFVLYFAWTLFRLGKEHDSR